jgi:hypothetical protein
MLDISLAGLIGAIVGTAIAGVTYHLSIGALDRQMRERTKTQTAEEQDKADTAMSLIRRVILATDVLLFAGLGYWIGHTYWG